MFYLNKIKPSVVAGLALSMLLLGGVFAPLSHAAGPELRHDGHFSQNYVFKIDPKMAETAGEALYSEVMEFFNAAEAAIEAKDIDKLSALYSDSYTNGERKKGDIVATWKRLFADFNNLAMTHNMRLSVIDPTGKVVVMKCSGIIVGVPPGESGPAVLDYWMNSDHVLTKDDGKWKIIGSSGAEKKRLWFDKPLHPLF